MKKLIALLLALVMVIGLVACGGPGDEPTGEPTPPVSDTTPEPSKPVDEPSDPPAVELVGTMTQVVTVNLLGNDIPVDLIRNFETGAFRIDYEFKDNAVFAEGFVLEDGTWEITDTNNDFTFGTIEAIIPAIDDSAWVAASSELTVVRPAEEPEPSVEPTPDPEPVDPNAESVAQTVTVDMMGNATEVYVVKTGNHFEMSYTAMGNDVVLTGSIDGESWIFETASVEAVAAFASNIVNSVVAALDESAWTPVEAPAAEVVAQTVTVDMMGNATEVYVVKTGNHFEMSYTAMGNDVVLTGSIDGESWIFETASVEAVAAFASNIVNSVVAALDESAWTPVEAPAAEAVAQTVTVDMMGNATEVYVVKTGNHFEMNYTAMGNDVTLTGSIDGGTWIFETSNVEAVAAFAGNIVNSVVDALDEAAWTPVE